jgi:hypothetical protein
MGYIPKPVEIHAADLGRLIIEFSDEDNDNLFDWLQSADWLLIAAGVTHIEFDRAKLDPQFGYCRGADDFELRRDELHARFLLDLARFTYSWGALESIISIIKPYGMKKGKIAAACRYINTHFDPSPGVPLFDILTEKLKTLYDESNVSKKVAEYGAYGAPLKVVYEKRNEFAHGALHFPVPEEGNSSHSDITHIRVSTTIVLLSIQMLMISFISERGISTNIQSFWWDDYEDGANISDLLRVIQVEPPEYDSSR